MKKILLFFLAAFLLISSFAACGKNEGGAQSLTLVGFESYDEMWYGLRSEYIGYAKLTSDERGVTQGEKCLYFEMNGVSDNAWYTRTYDLKKIPSFRFFKQSNTMPAFDFNLATGFRVDVYNDTDREIDLIFVIDKQASAYEESQPIYTDLKFLQPGCGNSVYFPINRKFLQEAGASVYSYALYIHDSRVGEKTTKLYFDNFRVDLADKVYEPQQLNKTFDDGEILGFASPEELDYTQTYCTANVLNGCYEFVPLLPGQTRGGIRYTFSDFNGSGGLPNTDFYPKNEKVGFTVAKEILDGLPGGGFDHISIEVYNTSTEIRRVYIQLKDGRGNQKTAYKDVPPYRWTQVKIGSLSAPEGGLETLNIYTNTYTITEGFELYFKDLCYERQV